MINETILYFINILVTKVIKMKNLKNLLLIKILVTTALFMPKWSLASTNDISNGANAYLVTKTWAPNEQYNATHFLMVPLHYAYQNNDPQLIQKFDAQMALFTQSNLATMNLNDDSQRLQLLQYFYLLSQYSVLSKNKQPELSKYLLQNISNIWTQIPAWQWQRKPFSNMKERVQWKLHADNDVGFKRAIIDEEFFTFAVAADLSKTYPNNPVLQDINQTSFKVFQQRSSFDQANRWLFDKGSWDSHPDLAYAGYADTHNIHEKKTIQNSVMDSSHFLRMPLILKSLQNSFPADTNEHTFYQRARVGLEKQLFEKVLVRNNNNIQLTNYMDGRNGVYRWNYKTMAKDTGYGPYELTSSFGMGWWVFLPNQRINDLYRQYHQQITTDDINQKKCDRLSEVILQKQTIINRKTLNQCMYWYNTLMTNSITQK